MLYVYAIIEPAGGVSGCGLEEQPLEAQAHDAVAAVFSRHDARIAPSPENLWRHERVVEGMMRDLTLLPSRFGTMVADEAALRDIILAHASELSAGLERVRGCVELGLRMLWPQEQSEDRTGDHDPSDQTTSGRAYMLARLAAARRRKRLEEMATSRFDAVHAELAALARDSTRRAASGSQPAFAAAYLVEREAMNQFRDRVRQLRHARNDVRMLCTGPWPPYNFVPVLRHTAAAEVRHA